MCRMLKGVTRTYQTVTSFGTMILHFRASRATVEFLAEYASFLAKTATLVIAILVVLSTIAGLRGKGRRKPGGQLQVTRLNEF